MLPFLGKMKIDEQRLHVLTNFNPIRRGGRAIESDHNTEILELNLQFDRKKTDRRELFNFRNGECQEAFFKVTSETTKLSECFSNNLAFPDQAKKWNKELNNIFHLSFRKVRVVEGKIKENGGTKLLEERKSLKKKLANSTDENCDQIKEKL